MQREIALFISNADLHEFIIWLTSLGYTAVLDSLLCLSFAFEASLVEIQISFNTNLVAEIIRRLRLS